MKKIEKDLCVKKNHPIFRFFNGLGLATGAILEASVFTKNQPFR